MFKPIVAAALAAGALAAAPAAAFVNVWSTDFDGGVVFQNIGPFPASSLGLTVPSGIVFTSSGGAPGLGSDFLHNDTNSTTKFEIFGLGAHDTINVSFDLLFIDSWDGFDGTCCAPDYLYVDINGLTDAYSASIALGSADYFGTGSLSNYGYYTGNGYWPDKVVHYNFTLPHSASYFYMTFNAGGSGFQYGIDESWGIDNLSISANPVRGAVPEPASWAMLIAGFGLVGGALRARRKALPASIG